MKRSNYSVSNDKGTGAGITLAELIPSKDVRTSIEEAGCVLTDFEKTTLIYNHSGMSFTEKAAHLKELMEQTEDGNLREEIKDRLSYDELCVSRFYENDGAYIYELQVYDPEEEKSCERGYYKSGSVAVTCGKKFQKNFNVHKVRLVTEEKEPENCCSDCIVTLGFDNLGQVQGYYSSEVEWTAKKPELDRGRFENAYIEIPHPFRNGDLVRAKNNNWLKDEVCIVECNNDEIDETIKEQCYANRDYSDAFLRVAYIYASARFGHEHVKIVDLEYATLDETDEKYGLLCCNQDLMAGKGGLSELQFLCDEYCGKQKNRR